jgi:arylsulfatase A-like enzyme
MANYEPSMIDADILTLPEMLQDAGYTTAGFGKWHLGTTFPTLDGEKPVGYGKFRADDNGANLDLSKPVSDGPLDHGFQHWLGFSCASECWILEDNRIMGAIKHELYTIEATPNADHIRQIPLEDYLPFLTDNTLDFLKNQTSEPTGKPFFLYFAPYVPHIPLAVSTRFQGSTQAGLYGDYVHELDYYLGKILNALDSLGLADNTIVLFASDNGSQFPASSNAMDMTKASNSSAAMLKADETAAVHYPNAPLRGTKWTIYEGGVRTPLIVRWPGTIPAGKVSDGLFALNDVLPSLAAAVGYKLPANAAEDGYNLLPVLTQGRKSSRKEVVVQSSGNVLGIREGNWKFIGAGNYKPENPDDPPGELYDLSTDIQETNNLYLQHPQRAAKMKAKLLQMLKDEVKIDNSNSE